MDDCKLIKTPMPTNGHLDLDEGGKSVDQTLYHSMIGSLLYLTASEPDIMFSVCMCARFQANPKESHLSAIKRILRYLKHTPSIGLWYPKGASFTLLGYSDSDFAGCHVDRKSTSGGCHLQGSAIKIASNPVQHSRTKHIDIRHHFLRHHVGRNDILLCGVRSEDQLADIFTKPLDESTFVGCEVSLTF